MTVRGGRLVLVGLMAGGLGLGMPMAASAQDLTRPAVSVSDGVSTMELTSTQTSQMFVPRGGAPTTEFPESEPGEGDAISFEELLHQSDALVGTDKGVCTFESFGTMACKVIVTFADGTLNVAARIAEDEKGPSVFDLVSGTGAFTGVEGKANVETVDDTHSKITLRYTVPRATQVSMLPAGGAATGGGQQDHGTDAALIIGVGIAAVAGSLGLFAAAHAAARRD